MSTCVCCGRPALINSSHTDAGPIHFDCWEDHHSDPTGVWPPEHTCKFDPTGDPS